MGRTRLFSTITSIRGGLSLDDEAGADMGDESATTDVGDNDVNNDADFDGDETGLEGGDGDIHDDSSMDDDAFATESLFEEATSIGDTREADFDKYYDVAVDESKKGVQFMITSKMKNILVNELGYLEEEVRDMEPQIAVVVIERQLRRPMDGMPVAWKRPGKLVKERSSGNQINAFLDSVKEKLSNSGKLPIIGASLIGGFALFTNRALLFKATGFILGKVASLTPRLPGRGGKSKSRSRSKKPVVEAAVVKDEEAAGEEAVPEPPKKRKPYSIKIRKQSDYKGNAPGSRKAGPRPTRPTRPTRPSPPKIDAGKLGEALKGFGQSLFGKKSGGKA